MKEFNHLKRGKKRFCFVLFLLLSISSHLYAEQGYAVLASNGDDVVITEGTGANTEDIAYPGEGKTLTFFYGTPIGTVGVDYFNTDNTGESPGWFSENPYITRVVFDVTYVNARPRNCQRWFSDCSNLSAIAGIENLNTDEVTNMHAMFNNCSKLATLDVTHFTTTNVTNMSLMFAYCSSLSSLDFTGTGFNTSNVVNMRFMFANCEQLTSLDLRGFDTSNVTNMENMFYNCKQIEEIRLKKESFKTHNVEKMGHLFAGCNKLSSIDVTGFNTSNVISMTGMFASCGNLTALDVTNFDTSNVTSMAEMFSGCSSLTTLDVSMFDTSLVEYMNHMFYRCSSLTTLTIKGNPNKFKTPNVKNMAAMFYSCSSLRALDVTGFEDTSNVTSMANMFAVCSSLPSIDVTGFNTSNVINMTLMFASCSNLTALDVTNFDTSNVENMQGMFQGCSGLTSLDIKNFETSKVKYMQNMFYLCRNMTSLELDKNKFDTSNVTSMSNMFAACSSLPSIDVSGFNTSNVTFMSGMFSGCSGMTYIDVAGFNTCNVTDMRNMFSYCTNLICLTFGNNFSTENVQTYRKNSETDLNAKYDGCRQMWSLFKGAPKIRYIDFYKSDNANAITEINRTSEENMFYNVPRTTVIYLPHGSSSVTDAENVVYTGNDPMAGGGSHGGGAQILKCPNYYSEDKVDIEFPRTFRTNKAEYSRAMSSSYGSVVLPYVFKSNENIQAYTLDEEHTETMYFVDAEMVPAHTPFAFKKLRSAEFVNEDATGQFGVTVEATHTTKASEGGSPYTHSENLGGWTTKGYYVYDYLYNYSNTFYIAGDKFYRADGGLTMYPHRVTFHGAWSTEPSSDSSSKFFDITTVACEQNLEVDDKAVADAIDAAETRKDVRNAEAVYDMHGRKRNDLHKGLNIIRMADGTAKKVVIK